MVFHRSFTQTIAAACYFLTLACSTKGQPIVVRQYTVVNKCPASIDLYIAGVYDATLTTGASTTTTAGVDAGFFYTTANGGDTTGDATRAGFFGTNDGAYYYIVADTAQFNTGISITPNNYSPSGGFCGVAECDDVSCTNVFTQPPTGFPPISDTPPNPPVYSCQHSDVAFTIT
ncbi:hypothetical protein CPB84DRAFT_1721400 [Gymnopilus junonius]|uniref:Uncharacterized protein n=1 Tax=Gymnopilus junonius TaxID=109634 RepID=A0A9P5P2B5_GYMJU|nr:hypothetical protein CPB84DRAFT_1721400 [Gymnopilus junonius]